MKLTSNRSSTALADRMAAAATDTYSMPVWGNPISPGELITILLQREGTRDEAMETLAQTLADLGISGEEVAHWQKRPGICHDCNDTEERVRGAWQRKAQAFSQSPIEMYKGYTKEEAFNLWEAGQ